MFGWCSYNWAFIWCNARCEGVLSVSSFSDAVVCLLWHCHPWIWLHLEYFEINFGRCIPCWLLINHFIPVPLSFLLVSRRYLPRDHGDRFKKVIIGTSTNHISEKIKTITWGKIEILPHAIKVLSIRNSIYTEHCSVKPFLYFLKKTYNATIVICCIRVWINTNILRQ